MNVQHALRKRFKKDRCEETHIAGKADEIDFVLAQAGNDLRIVLRSRQTFSLNHVRIESAPLSCLDAGNVGLIGDDNRDLRIWNLSGSDVIGDSDKVGAASGEEN